MALSPEIKDAINNIESHASQLQAVLTLADYVKDIGALEQAASEAENRKSAADAELERIQQAADDERGAAAKAKEDIASAKTKATGIVADAEVKAGNIVAIAEDEARAIVSKANNAAEQRAREADTEVQEARAKLSLVKTDVAAEQERLADLTAQCEAVIKKADEARAYLADLASRN